MSLAGNSPYVGLCVHELSQCGWCHGSTTDVGAALTKLIRRQESALKREQALAAMPQVTATIVPVPTTARSVDPLPPALTDWATSPSFIPRNPNPRHVVLTSR